MSLHEAAMNYARNGWTVFPCEPKGKKPLCEHGLKDATTNEKTIHDWWTRWPDANIGHPTGTLIVLDVDGKEGERSMAELEEKYGKLPVTTTAKTGRGRHLYLLPNGAEIKNNTGKLGPHLDIRGEGGYVILPPSVHEGGTRYLWAVKVKPACLPGWLAALLAGPTETDAHSGADTSDKIPKGQRHAHLLRIAGKLREEGCNKSTIAAALLAENTSRCEPAKADSDIRKLAHDVCTRYPAGTPSAKLRKFPTASRESPWDSAEDMQVFLEADADEAEFLDQEKRIVARQCVTQIFAPRGLGKSLFVLWLAVQFAKRGLRVMIIDRDNPRRVLKKRLGAFGANAQIGTLKVITREKCPPLTNAMAWAIFPFEKYDVVIIDSLDSAAEGVGEQDSAKPSKAIAPVLDIARRENGPAVIVLGNTVRTGQHSRGSGVVEDRADIVYEVRDATNFNPTGSKPWFEELPAAGAEAWALRGARRKQRDKYRLAFVASKFRIGQEPEPFIVEIDTTTSPWSIEDVTDDVDKEGAAYRKRKAEERARAIQDATALLVAEIKRRLHAGEPEFLKKQAEEFLTRQNITQKLAREALQAPDINIEEAAGKGHPKTVRLAAKNGVSNRNTAIVEPAQTQGESDAHFGGPVSMHPTEIEPSQTSINSGSNEGAISVEDSVFSPRRPRVATENEPFGGVENGMLEGQL